MFDILSCVTDCMFVYVFLGVCAQVPVGVCGFDVPVCGIDSASVALRSALLILTWFQTRVCVLVLCTQSQHQSAAKARSSREARARRP